ARTGSFGQRRFSCDGCCGLAHYSMLRLGFAPRPLSIVFGKKKCTVDCPVCGSLSPATTSKAAGASANGSCSLTIFEWMMSSADWTVYGTSAPLISSPRENVFPEVMLTDFMA